MMDKFTLRDIQDLNQKSFEHRMNHMVACLEAVHGSLLLERSTGERLVFANGAVFQSKFWKYPVSVDMVWTRVYPLNVN
jgi:hypothetical protein